MPAAKKKESEEKVTAEQVQQAVAQAAQAYFTPQVNAEINELSDERMFDILRGLEQSEFWYALLRYNNKRLLVAQSLINSIDPVQQPTAISRTQGVMTGIVDLQNAIIQLVESEKAAVANAKEISDLA